MFEKFKNAKLKIIVDCALGGISGTRRTSRKNLFSAARNELGITANFTPWWHNGGELSELAPIILGKERAAKMYRCKTIWDTGALVTWSSDNVTYGDFKTWNPLLGMEVGMTRWITEKTNLPAHYINPAEFPPASEKISVAKSRRKFISAEN